MAFLYSCGGSRPEFVNKGLELADCPKTPNCVLTTLFDDAHKIAPIAYTGTDSVAVEKLISIINSLDRTEIITKNKNYLYVEFKSKMWKFVDDVEFLFDTQNKIINFRSASRLGKSDFGVNRDRMEKIRSLFLAK